jgi:hypothetical protein
VAMGIKIYKPKVLNPLQSSSAASTLKEHQSLYNKKQDEFKYEYLLDFPSLLGKRKVLKKDLKINICALYSSKEKVWWSDKLADLAINLPHAHDENINLSPEKIKIINSLRSLSKDKTYLTIDLYDDIFKLI